jgi:hypothetical protein
MLYEDVLRDHEAGLGVRALAARHGLPLAVVREILDDAGRTCRDCGIILSECGEGVAETACGQVCQTCAETRGREVLRWVVEPVGYATVYELEGVA